MPCGHHALSMSCDGLVEAEVVKSAVLTRHSNWGGTDRCHQRRAGLRPRVRRPEEIV